MNPMSSLVLHINFPAHQPLAEVLACAQEIVDQAQYLDAHVSTSATGLSQAAAEMLADALELPLLPRPPATEEEQVNQLRQRITEAFTGNNHRELARHFGVSTQFIYSTLALRHREALARALEPEHLADAESAYEVRWASPANQLGNPLHFEAGLRVVETARAQGRLDQLQVVLAIRHAAPPTTTPVHSPVAPAPAPAGSPPGTPAPADSQPDPAGR